jgi:hypothetical protein
MANNEEKQDKKESSSKASGSDSKLSDTIKKIITAGSPSDISKELVQTVVSNVMKTKDDIAIKATNEMISLIRRIDFVKEFSKFAQEHKFKVSAEIEIFKKDSVKKDE